MKRVAAILVGVVILGIVGCGSKSEDDGLKLDPKKAPPVDAPANGAKPPEVETGKGVEGEGK